MESRLNCREEMPDDRPRAIALLEIRPPAQVVRMRMGVEYVRDRQSRFVDVLGNRLTGLVPGSAALGVEIHDRVDDNSHLGRFVVDYIGEGGSSLIEEVLNLHNSLLGFCGAYQQRSISDAAHE